MLGAASESGATAPGHRRKATPGCSRATENEQTGLETFAVAGPQASSLPAPVWAPVSPAVWQTAVHVGAGFVPRSRVLPEASLAHGACFLGRNKEFQKPG